MRQMLLSLLRRSRPPSAPAAFKAAARAVYEAKRGPVSIQEVDGCHLVTYGTDLDTYREVQNLVNAAKLKTVFVVESNIAKLATYWRSREPNMAPKVLCHGTRNGAEQRWFAKHFQTADVLGTDIADSATTFPNTIQWDFHDVKPEWLGAFDIVYSNSWDHARDPHMAFANWAACLKPSGLMFLEHSLGHEGGDEPSDCFGATRAALIALLDKIGAGQFHVIDVIEGLRPSQERRCAIVVSH